MHNEKDTFQQTQWDINNLIRELEDTIFYLDTLKSVIRNAELKIQELEKQLNESTEHHK